MQNEQSFNLAINNMIKSSAFYDSSASYDQLFTATLSTLVDGQRIYYAEPLIAFEPRLKTYSALVFKIRQIVQNSILRELGDLDHLNNKGPNRPKPTQYLDIMQAAIDDNTWAHQEKFSNRINNQWGVTPFETWLEESFPHHWMTMKYYKQASGDSYYDSSDDFASMLCVYVPVDDIEKFKQEYGEAFVLTKLMYG
jgi:hypothetical protein